MKTLFFLFIFISLVVAVFSYGFTDPNLVLLKHPFFVSIQGMLHQLVYAHTGTAALITGSILITFFVLYIGVLRLQEKATKEERKKFIKLFIIIGIILLLSYPMFSYDVFNYILTAKLTYFWKENPYVVMPIEISNDPNLMFTRAANKLALYGPTWISATFLPSLVGFGNVWLSIIAFKVLVGAWYGIFLWMIYRFTKTLWNVVFFALNPLILSEVFINGHNDILMMVLSLGGLLLWQNMQPKYRYLGFMSFVASIFVKGASIVLIPLFFLRWPMDKILSAGFWLMFGVLLLTPIREEMYPWYAVWVLTFAALIPKNKAKFIHSFSIVLSFGLLMRHLPYIVTREYGGVGPLWRLLLTAVPVVVYLFFRFLKSISRKDM
ncbi:hypothetical protein KJ618_02485 [Patescibacteria group bacterium]|nr:hypothetical protein [Patescibacteria group bacterium]MBU2544313.1 hypothetical protein [Patescibacteria group bacterium]